MNALDQLSAYLRHLERRLRLSTASRGLAVLGAVALAATVALVLIINEFAFSSGSVAVARVVLFLAVAFAIAFGLLIPLLRTNSRKVARRAEDVFPEFQQRLLTFAEVRQADRAEPFLELLADDALQVARTAEPTHVVTARRIAGLLATGAAAVGVLIWLSAAGPGFLGYGSSLLWAGNARGGDSPFYDILVSPGNHTVRRRGDQLVTARLIGFQAAKVRLYARFESTSKWEELAMQPEPGGSGFEFLFAGIPEPVEYYVEAGAVRSEHYRLNVIDLPVVRRIRVTYRFPEWLRKEDVVEERGGDLRAVQGTEAELAVETDKPLLNGSLVLDDGTTVDLSPEGGNWARGTLPIEKDGLYHVAVLEQKDLVRLTEDFFIEAQQEHAPTVRIRRPGRDYRANPIEEVTVEVEAGDDFGLHEVSLRYSVNGGPERNVQLLKSSGAGQSGGSTVLYLENEKLVPGDLVSFYALARDARNASRTDMFFIEAQPFEREYSQAQQSGGMMSGADEQNRISERQKEIIAATWNLLRDRDRSPQKAAEDSKFLSDVQSKLQAQARTLAQRMKARQLASANEEFRMFSENMEAAARAMGEAADNLKGRKLRDALPPEQKALQHLLRAESVFRQIQVAMGSRGGGGGGGGLGRDLENLFDLELDTEKNQYETGQQAASADQRSREIDEALQRLEQLARRQQELADQQRRGQQSFQQRWQQEMLRREAEQLQRRMEELMRGNSSQQMSERLQRMQSGSPQSGSSGQSGDPRLEQALERLRQATEDMRRAASSSGQERNDAESRRAAERLQEATELLGRMRRQESSQRLGDLADRAERLARQQREFSDQLRDMYKDHRALGGQQQGAGESQQPADPREVQRLAEQKSQMAEDLQRLERDLQNAVRDLAAGQQPASSKLREALGEMQQRELSLRMKYLAEWIRRGFGAYAWLREAPVTEGLNRLAEQVREAEQALGEAPKGQDNLETALARVEQLRRQIEQLTQQGRQGQPGQAQQGQAQQGQAQQGQQASQAQGSHGAPSYGPDDRRSAEAARPEDAPGGSGWTFSAMNTGERRFTDTGIRPPATDRQALERSYREGVRDLSELRRALGENREIAEDVSELIREMQRLDPSRFPGNPELVEQLRTQLLPNLEQLELRLRRELEGGEAGAVRSGLSSPVPSGYADAVAEYFRRLSSRK